VSSTTWTLRAVASEARRTQVKPWRAVESQHRASTLTLVDSFAEQALLEDLIEQAKPPIPEEARTLDYLLATPFRYPPSPYGSRFRTLADPGVLYAANEIRTACAEAGYWRWRFMMDSPALLEMPAVSRTLFQSWVSGSTIDLRAKPFAKDRSKWTHPNDYSHCHAIARLAREAQVQLIAYESVRDPDHGGCVAVLTPAAFAKRSPIKQESWLLTVTQNRVYWQRQSGDSAFELDPARAHAPQ
jgi:hypothetical protein